jgi:hypothetical protein
MFYRDVVFAEERRKDLLREAEQHRLARQSTRTRPGWVQQFRQLFRDQRLRVSSAEVEPPLNLDATSA